MKKYLLALVLIMPVIALAGDLNMTVTDDFVNTVKDVESKIDEAGQLLDGAVNTFFGLLDSVVTLPQPTQSMEEIMTAMEEAKGKKAVEAAQELYENHLKELAARDAALDEMWNNSDVKAEIVSYFSNRKEMAVGIKDNVEKALALDVAALKAVPDLPAKGQAAVEDLTNQITADPMAALQGKKVITAVKESIDSIKKIKENATKQKETADKLLTWLKDLVS